MDAAIQHWKILQELDRDFLDRIREFLVIGKDGEGVVMATEPDGQGFWYGKMKFGEETRVATKPTRLGVSKLIKMAHGWDHIVLLDELRQIYVIGLNDQGQLGLGTDDKTTHFSPQLIPGSQRFIFIRCGKWHSLAICENGKVWGWGWNHRGQLGLPRSTSPVTSPRQIELLDEHRVLAVECGGDHSLARTSSDEVYAWGSNQYGQLGHHDGIESYSFVKYHHKPTLLADSVRKIAAGRHHTMLLTELGQVFVCGSNKAAQLGLAPTFAEWCPDLFQMHDLPRISKIYSHHSTHLSIALSMDNRCFVWGQWNKVDTPTPLKLLPSYSTVESPLSFGYPYNTPHSVRIED